MVVSWPLVISGVLEHQIVREPFHDYGEGIFPHSIFMEVVMTGQCSIEKITGDNRRPGMPQEGFLVRYNPHPDFGWLSCRSFGSRNEALSFAFSLEEVSA